MKLRLTVLSFVLVTSVTVTAGAIPTFDESHDSVREQTDDSGELVHGEPDESLRLEATEETIPTTSVVEDTGGFVGGMVVLYVLTPSLVIGVIVALLHLNRRED